jgi:hypothetical protein
MWEFFSVFFSKQVPLLLISTSDVHLPTRRQLIISRTDSPMFAQIHYKALMPTPLRKAKYFLFCGKYFKCSNGQYIAAYLFTKIMMQSVFVPMFIISDHAIFYRPVDNVSKSKGGKK